MPHDDRVRIAEAFRLADEVGESLWPGLKTAPFAVLLVTPDREFLVRHPQPSPDFTAAGVDPVLGQVYSRPRQFDVALLASFPAVSGVPTIVIGQPANTTVKRSTAWVLTVVHEHFHQWQSSRPGYYEAVNALGLAHGDTSGGWMLNYAFPYDRADVQAQFATMCRLLADALVQPRGEQTVRAAAAYRDARRALLRLITADDAKYLAFQVWQEGVARYTEERVAAQAAAAHTPSREFAALSDVTAYDTEAQALLARVRVQLESVKLGAAKRTAFYAVGAGEGLLLDRLAPGWRSRYLDARFDLEPLFPDAR